MPNVLRIIDANANRAREAMRVLEEAARFILNDVELSAALKAMRHDFGAALATVEGLEDNRDTAGDVGTRISTDDERVRGDILDVVTAAGKRLGEALRAIEEYGKTLGEPACAVGVVVEALRYRAYELERRVKIALPTGRGIQWRLCVLITEALCPGGDWQRIATTALEAGADCIQIREKDVPIRELVDRIRRLVDLCRPHGAAVIVNDRPDVAWLAGADGVHLGQEDLTCADARRLVGRQLLIGVSTSRLEEADRAIRQGADYCGIGPMFATTTKKKDHIVGPNYARAFVTRFPTVPHLAIGGVTAKNVDQLVSAGVAGVAVSSAVCRADDPASEVTALLQALKPATPVSSRKS